VILFFHQSCLSRIPSESLANSDLKALVCGENFSARADSELYVSTGLIHLFVVSGTHLLLLEKFLGHFIFHFHRFNKFLILLCLFIYVLMCDFNPPIVRSFVSLVGGFLLVKCQLNWPSSFRILLVGLMTLLINPAWISSISLQLSWLAGLVVSLQLTYFKKENFLWQQSLYFIFLFPILIFLCVPSPFIILVNLFFAPMLELILFPLGLIVCIFPFTYVLFDRVIEVLNFILGLLEFKTTAQTFLDNGILVSFGWLVILALHFCLHLLEMQYRKKNYV